MTANFFMIPSSGSDAPTPSAVVSECRIAGDDVQWFSGGNVSAPGAGYGLLSGFVPLASIFSWAIDQAKTVRFSMQQWIRFRPGGAAADVCKLNIAVAALITFDQRIGNTS